MGIITFITVLGLVRRAYQSDTLFLLKRDSVLCRRKGKLYCILFNFVEWDGEGILKFLLFSTITKESSMIHWGEL